jgi:hypothetical protein
MVNILWGSNTRSWSRQAASHLPPGLNAQGAARYVMVHGMSAGFSGAIGFTGSRWW